MAEVAYVSRNYGWSLAAALDLEHGDRRWFIDHLVDGGRSDRGDDR